MMTQTEEQHMDKLEIEVAGLLGTIEELQQQLAEKEELHKAEANVTNKCIRENLTFKAQLTTSRDQAKRLREGLVKLEWIYKAPGICYTGHFLIQVCLVCGGMHLDTPKKKQIEGYVLGHKPDCWLSKLLEETKEL